MIPVVFDTSVIISSIVSYDEDLLASEKPFGIQVLRPPRFLEWFQHAHG